MLNSEKPLKCHEIVVFEEDIEILLKTGIDDGLIQYGCQEGNGMLKDKATEESGGSGRISETDV